MKSFFTKIPGLLRILLSSSYRLRFVPPVSKPDVAILDFRNSETLQEAARRLDYSYAVVGTRYETLYLKEILLSACEVVRRPTQFQSFSHAYFTRLLRLTSCGEVWSSSTFTSTFYLLSQAFPLVDFKFFQLVIVDDATLNWRSSNLENVSFTNVTVFCHSLGGGSAHLDGLHIGDLKPLGSLRNNLFSGGGVQSPEVAGTVVTLVSQFRNDYEGRGYARLTEGNPTKMWADSYPRFLSGLSAWIRRSGFSLHIIPAVNNSSIAAELDYYRRHLDCSWEALDNSKTGSYELAIRATHLVSSHSTLAFEMAARGMRVTVCPPAHDLGISGQFWENVYRSDPAKSFVAIGVESLERTLDRTRSATSDELRHFAANIRKNVINLMSDKQSLSLIHC